MQLKLHNDRNSDLDFISFSTAGNGQRRHDSQI